MSIKISKSINEDLGLYWVIRKSGKIIARLPIEEDPDKYVRELSKPLKSKSKSKLKSKKKRGIFG